jgi:hypothetical protein
LRISDGSHFGKKAPRRSVMDCVGGFEGFGFGAWVFRSLGFEFEKLESDLHVFE